MTTLERMPPQAVELEQSVLAAMMMDPQAIDAARDILSSESFYHIPHAPLFDAILSLHDAGQPTDQLSIGEHLASRGKLDVCGGLVYVATVASCVATWRNVEPHAKIVRQKHMLRTLIEKIHALSESAYSQGEDAQVLISGAVDQLSEMVVQDAKGGLVSFEPIIGLVLEMIEKAHASGGRLTGVNTGLASANTSTGGWQPGDSIILAARPSVGKTALALQMGTTAAEDGVDTDIFSLEMSKEQLGQRILAQKTGLDLRRLRTGALQDADWLHLTKGVGKIAQLPIHIDDRPGATVAQIRSQLRRRASTGHLGLVIIDYLQLMVGDDKRGREQEISKISRGIKGMAREFNIPIITLSQFSRGPEGRTDKRPRLSDLRESGSIEQDADVACLLYKPSDYDISEVATDSGKISTENAVELNIAKQRNGPTGAFWMTWNPQATLFSEMAPAYRDAPDFVHPNN